MNQLLKELEKGSPTAFNHFLLTCNIQNNNIRSFFKIDDNSLILLIINFLNKENISMGLMNNIVFTYINDSSKPCRLEPKQTATLQIPLSGGSEYGGCAISVGLLTFGTRDISYRKDLFIAFFTIMELLDSALMQGDTSFLKEQPLVLNQAPTFTVHENYDDVDLPF